MALRKKKLLVAVSVIIVLTSLALAFFFIIHESSHAVGSPSAPTQTPTSTLPPTKTSSGGLELTVSLEKTVYNFAEPVNITLTITNISQQTVNFTSTGMNFDFIVYNDTNNLVYQWSYGQAFPAIAFIKPLEPGESVTATYVWPQTVKNSMTSTENVQVSPGTYYIIGKSNQIYGLITASAQITILKP